MPQSQILWTAFALEQIRLIFQYYRDTAGINVAERITNDIIDYTDILTSYPHTGQEDEILKSRGKGYRHLVKGNYKIIYSIHNNVIHINDIFDTRLNPAKLIKRNK